MSANPFGAEEALFVFATTVLKDIELAQILLRGGGFIKNNYFVWPFRGTFFGINPSKQIVVELSSSKSDPDRSLIVKDKLTISGLYQDLMAYIDDINYIENTLKNLDGDEEDGPEEFNVQEAFFSYAAEIFSNPYFPEIFTYFNAHFVNGYLIWQTESQGEEVYLAVNPTTQDMRELEFPNQKPQNGIKVSEDEYFEWIFFDLTTFVDSVNKYTAFNSLPLPPEAKYLGNTPYSAS